MLVRKDDINSSMDELVSQAVSQSAGIHTITIWQTLIN